MRLMLLVVRLVLRLYLEVSHFQRWQSQNTEVFTSTIMKAPLSLAPTTPKCQVRPSLTTEIN
jgi:hypothetical protein